MSHPTEASQSPIRPTDRAFASRRAFAARGPFRLHALESCCAYRIVRLVATALIVGSGPAAASVATALSHRSDLAITVLDAGLRLEPDRQDLVDVLSSSDSTRWDDELVEIIAEQPVQSRGRGLPQKRAYGSDFPFRDVGQLGGVTPADNANRSMISAAYGGFSNVWGAQVMPFAASVFETWPVSASEMRPHYERVLNEIPFAAEEDDLADLFPLIGRPAPLPEVSERTRRVLDGYARHRPALNDLGMTLGKARLALDAPQCVRCGLCMTGCPYSLIYSASQTFDKLRRADRVTYLDGLLGVEVGEDNDGPFVTAEELATGHRQRFRADRIFVACGAVGTTRLVLNSLRLFDVDVAMGESQQFLLPMLSLRATLDPRDQAQFTLNQFNMTVALDAQGYDLAQLHFYTYNAAFVDALPRFLRGRLAGPMRNQLLRRLSVSFGYLPSWRSPAIVLRARPPVGNDALPELQLSGSPAPRGRRQMLRTVMTRMLLAAPRLDLYPLLPLLRLSGPGKSYHVGGSFPHASRPRSTFSSDRVGRVGAWKRIHLVDGSVFPSVPATTFTLTVMANAHRIGSEIVHSS